MLSNENSFYYFKRGSSEIAGSNVYVCECVCVCCSLLFWPIYILHTVGKHSAGQTCINLIFSFVVDSGLRILLNAWHVLLVYVYATLLANPQALCMLHAACCIQWLWYVPRSLPLCHSILPSQNNCRSPSNQHKIRFHLRYSISPVLFLSVYLSLDVFLKSHIFNRPHSMRRIQH